MRALLLLILFVANSFAATRIKDLTTILGTGTSNNVLLQANLGGANNPTIRYNSTEAKWQRSDDGINFSDIGSGSSDEFNILLNTTFEKATYDESWTTTGSTSTRSKETSILLPGKTGAFKSVASSQNLVLYQDATTSAAQLAGLQGYVSAWIYNSAPSVTICARAAGVTLSGNNCLTLATDSLYKQYVIPVVLSATSNGVYISGTGITGTTIVGKVTVGLLPNMMPEVAQAQIASEAYFAGTVNCLWSRTSTTLGAFTADADCPGPTVTQNNIGSTQTTDADLPRVTVNNLPAGKYVVKFITGLATGASVASSASITDGTTTCAEFLVNTTTSIDATNIECVFEYTASGNRTFEIYARTASSTIEISNTSGTGSNRNTRFLLYYYPPASKIYSQECGDLRNCTNVFSAEVSSTGTVSGENLDWISGNCTNANPRVCTYNSSIFTVAPNCTVSAIDTTDRGATISAISSSSVSIGTFNTGGTASAQATKIICQKASTDFKAQSLITGTFANVMTTPGISKPKTCYYAFGGASATLASPTVCSTGTCVEVYDSCGTGTPPAFNSTGFYTGMTFSSGTFANSTPVRCACTSSAGVSGASNECYPIFFTGGNTWSSNSSGGYVVSTTHYSSAGSGINSYVFLECEGQAP